MRLPYYFFTVLITCFISGNLLGSTHFPLPTQYPLEKVSITISSQSGKDNSKNYQISINGNGNSFFSQNKEKQPLNITNDTLLELLNDFYAIHFFEVVDTFTVKKQVTLKNNKTVTTLIKKESNTSSKRVCIQLRSYKKCVTIIDNQPSAVDQIANKIETLLRPAHN